QWFHPPAKCEYLRGQWSRRGSCTRRRDPGRRCAAGGITPWRWLASPPPGAKLRLRSARSAGRRTPAAPRYTEISHKSKTGPPQGRIEATPSSLLRPRNHLLECAPVRLPHIVVLFALAALAAGDTIYLKNGRTITAE